MLQQKQLIYLILLIFIRNLSRMRFAQQRVSPHKHKNAGKVALTVPQVNHRLESEKSFVHYNNAIYMGAMISYKRNGKGMMLVDDGTSIISDYCFDTMTGHNVIFRDNWMMSVLFLKNQMFELVVRTGQFIAKIPFYEKENHPNGNGVLIDYEQMKVYHIVFQNGKIIKKIVESNKKIIERVMEQQRLSDIIDPKHQNALKFNMHFDNGIRILKEGKKITVGYLDSRYNLEGTGLKMKVNEDYDDFRNPLELKCVERGFYMRNRLVNYGERYFSNGNLYIGEFQDDLFNGQGLLLYPHEQKWVYGLFEGQRLIKMININLGKNEPAKSYTIRSCLRQIHEENSKNWMCNDIETFDWENLKATFNEVYNAHVTDIVLEKERIEREEKERLTKIQQHFSNEEPNSRINKVMEEQMNRNKLNAEKIILSEYSSLKTKVLEIQPRNIENEEYWSPKAANLRYSPSKILTPTHSNWKVNQQHKKPLRQQTQAYFSSNRKSPIKGHSPAKKYIYPTNH